MSDPLPTVELLGMKLAAIDGVQLLDHVFGSLDRGEGGWLVTANLDFMRRYVREPTMRRVYAGADLRVADGMPLVWASRMQGTPLPERVAGSSLVWPLCERAAREGRRVYLLGGETKASEAAAHKLGEAFPTLRIVGREAPRVSAEATQDELASVRWRLMHAAPDLVLVALGSPKQERVIAAVRDCLPAAWWMGVGISLSFVSGHVPRAPAWLQEAGLEWVHRLVQEPRRLFRRYVLEDLPFAFELFGRAAATRVRAAFD